MNKKLARLTESYLHRVVKESLRKFIKEEQLDAEPNYRGTRGDFEDVTSSYSKMPKGYDNDLSTGRDGDFTVDRVASLNKNYDSETYPYLKDIENKASWEAFDAARDSMYGYGNDDYYDSPVEKDSPKIFRDLENINGYSDADFDVLGTEWNKAKNESRNMNKKFIRLTESDLHRIVKESINRVINEGAGNTSFDRAIPEVIDFLSELARRLDNGLLGVEGFEGGNRMFAVSDIRSCVSMLEKICGKLYPTDATVKV